MPPIPVSARAASWYTSMGSAAPRVPDPAGKLVGYIGADADVTARKRAELEIVQQRNSLAHIARVSSDGPTGLLARPRAEPTARRLSCATPRPPSCSSCKRSP